MDFNGRTILSFESRMAEQMKNMIRKFNGHPIIAPSLKEIPVSQNQEVLHFVNDLLAGRIDGVIFTTGVGTQYLFDVVSLKYPLPEITRKISSLYVVARGPKPTKVLKEHGIGINIIAPEPNTWKEVLGAMDQAQADFDVRGKNIALQEYGVTNPELIEGLQQRGANVRPITVYRWALPDDTRPLQSAIHAVIDGKVDMALFTSAIQINHVLKVAKDMGKEYAFRDAFSKVVTCSVGPICTKGLEENHIKVDFMPSHPKQGHLVFESARLAEQLCSG